MPDTISVAEKVFPMVEFKGGSPPKRDPLLDAINVGERKSVTETNKKTMEMEIHEITELYYNGLEVKTREQIQQGNERRRGLFRKPYVDWKDPIEFPDALDWREYAYDSEFHRVKDAVLLDHVKIDVKDHTENAVRYPLDIDVNCENGAVAGISVHSPSSEELYALVKGTQLENFFGRHLNRPIKISFTDGSEFNCTAGDVDFELTLSGTPRIVIMQTLSDHGYFDKYHDGVASISTEFSFDAEHDFFPRTYVKTKKKSDIVTDRYFKEYETQEGKPPEVISAVEFKELLKASLALSRRK